MHDDEIASSTNAFERALAARRDPAVLYELQLFVAGSTVRSLQAVDRIRRLCEQHLNGRYELQVIDIYGVPALAQGEQVVAAPTLVRQRPAPPRRVVGDMADEDRVLRAVVGAGGVA